MVSTTLSQLASILVVLAFFAFLLFYFCFLLLLVGLEYCNLIKEPGTFFFQLCKVVVNITYSCLENGDFANLFLK